MVVFGADPNAEVKAWREEPTKPKRARADVYYLVSYFSYHPHMTMSQRSDDTDKAILGRFFAKKLDQGYQQPTLVSMIDRFYQSWGGSTDRPALVFVSNAVQDVLMQETEVVKDDPILSWMLNGMPDRGPFDDPKTMRKAVLLYTDSDVLNRYPDVVADILRIEGDLEATKGRLRTLTEAVRRKVSGHAPFPLTSDEESLMQTLFPKELQGKRAAPGSLRPLRPTVQQAIAAIPIDKAARRKVDCFPS